MGIKNVQNGAKNLPKWTPNGVPDGPVGGQDGSKIEKNRLKKATQHKTGKLFTAPPPFEPKKWPTWLQVGFQNRSKIDKKSMQKSIIFLMPLGIGFWVDVGGFWIPNSKMCFFGEKGFFLIGEFFQIGFFLIG